MTEAEFTAYCHELRAFTPDEQRELLLRVFASEMEAVPTEKLIEVRRIMAGRGDGPELETMLEVLDGQIALRGLRADPPQRSV